MDWSFWLNIYILASTLIVLAYWLSSIFHVVFIFAGFYIQGGGEGRLRERYAKSIEPILSEDLRWQFLSPLWSADCSYCVILCVTMYACLCLADTCTLTSTEFAVIFILNAFLSCMSRSRTIWRNIGMLLADSIITPSPQSPVARQVCMQKPIA